MNIFYLAVSTPHQNIQPRNDGILGSYQKRIMELLEESKQLSRKLLYTGHKVCKILDNNKIQTQGTTGNEIRIKSGLPNYWEPPLLINQAQPAGSKVVAVSP